MSQPDQINDLLDTGSNHSQSDFEGDEPLTLRALVTTKEAGVIIGKAGKNVAELRDATGVKAGVSKVVQGVSDRVLTVTGSLEGVAKAYSLIAQTLLDNPLQPETRNDAVANIQLLISHNLMGTVIGRNGTKIKHIQDTSGVRMTAHKDMLPQSTERVVDVKGTVEAIRIAIAEIGQCLMEDKERAVGTVLYNPAKASIGEKFHRNSITRTGNGSDFSDPMQRRNSAMSSNSAGIGNDEIRSQNIGIPSDMVGCIMGKGGSMIEKIRLLSGSKINISKTPNESNERMFEIKGTATANEKALYLLFAQLEKEKERRQAAFDQENGLAEE